MVELLAIVLGSWPMNRIILIMRACLVRNAVVTNHSFEIVVLIAQRLVWTEYNLEKEYIVLYRIIGIPQSDFLSVNHIISSDYLYIYLIACELFFLLPLKLNLIIVNSKAVCKFCGQTKSLMSK